MHTYTHSGVHGLGYGTVDGKVHYDQWRHFNNGHGGEGGGGGEGVVMGL